MPPAPNILKKKTFWTSRLFLGVLALKIVSSFVFASSYLTGLFTPFVNWFVLNGFQNPWNYFYSQGLIRMFPYPSVMLWILSFPRFLLSPFLSTDWHRVTALHLFAMRIPLIAFDILLLTQLLRLFPTQQKKVLIIYWCSPIVFFINYFHGQLDIIPTAIFFLSVTLLIREKYWQSIVTLAVATASKNYLFITLPFLAVFFYKKKISLRQTLLYPAIFLVVYGLLLLPYLRSAAFYQMVFHSPEQEKLFSFAIPVSPTFKLVLCPTVLILLFLKAASNKKLNREILFMFLGIVFACLVVFVPPMPGWFMWSFPFLVYFYINNREYSRAPFILYNVVYIFYFLFFFEREPLFFNRFKASFPVTDLALSIMMASVGYIAFWMFNLGIKKNEELKALEAPFLVGISGDSGSGKHMLLRVLKRLVGPRISIPIFGDDFHKWERGNENWNVYTHLDPSANRLHQNMESAVALKDGHSVEMVQYDHTSGRFVNPVTVEPNKLIFVVGLHPFYLKKMRELIHLKIFMDTDETLRRHWKIRRDVRLRGHDLSRVLEQIHSREEDKSKYIEPQKDYADLVIHYAPLTPPESAERPSWKRIPLKTTYRMDNSIDLDKLRAQLAGVPTLHVTHTSGINSQELEVSGSITAREVMAITYQLGFNFDELLINTRGWCGDHNGVSQLVFLTLYNHIRKV